MPFGGLPVISRLTWAGSRLPILDLYVILPSLVALDTVRLCALRRPYWFGRIKRDFAPFSAVLLPWPLIIVPNAPSHSFLLASLPAHLHQGRHVWHNRSPPLSPTPKQARGKNKAQRLLHRSYPDIQRGCQSGHVTSRAELLSLSSPLK